MLPIKNYATYVFVLFSNRHAFKNDMTNLLETVGAANFWGTSNLQMLLLGSCFQVVVRLMHA